MNYCSFDSCYLVCSHVPQNKHPINGVENPNICHRRMRGLVRVMDFSVDTMYYTKKLPSICSSNYDEPSASFFNLDLRFPYDAISWWWLFCSVGHLQPSSTHAIIIQTCQPSERGKRDIAVHVQVHNNFLSQSLFPLLSCAQYDIEDCWWSTSVLFLVLCLFSTLFALPCLKVAPLNEKLTRVCVAVCWTNYCTTE